MITGFLDKEAAPFAKALWKLLLSAQNGAQGVPQELLEAKKAELEKERVRITRTVRGCRHCILTKFIARRRESPRGSHEASRSRSRA